MQHEIDTEICYNVAIAKPASYPTQISTLNTLDFTSLNLTLTLSRPTKAKRKKDHWQRYKTFASYDILQNLLYEFEG